jgi:hypothetical protein
MPSPSRRILWGGVIFIAVTVIYLAVADSRTLSVHAAGSQPAPGVDVAAQESDVRMVVDVLVHSDQAFVEAAEVIARSFMDK